MISPKARVVMAMLVSAAVLSCADVPSTGPTPPDFRAEFRFVHAAPELGNVQLAVDGVQQGALDYAGDLAHREYPAGSREVALSSGERQFVAMSTNLRGTVVVLPALAGAPREFLRLSERRVFDAPQVAFRVANFYAPAAVDVTVTAGADTVLATSLAYKGVSNYRAVPAGSYTVEAKIAGSNTVLVSSPLSVSTSHTSMILGDASAALIKNVAD